MEQFPKLESPYLFKREFPIVGSYMDSVQEIWVRALSSMLCWYTLSGEITLQFNIFWQCEDTDIQQRKLKLEKFIYKNDRCREPKKKI